MVASCGHVDRDANHLDEEELGEQADDVDLDTVRATLRLTDLTDFERGW